VQFSLGFGKISKMVESLELRPPSRIKRALERAGLREIAPDDISPNRRTLNQLYKNYPDLAGDRTAIGYGDEGRCQSWRDCPGWWKELVGK
jgi:hypothetical protein